MTLPTYAVTGKRIWIVKLNLRKNEAQVDQVLHGQFDYYVLHDYRVLHM